LTTQLAEDSMTIHRGFSEVVAKQLQSVFIIAIGLGFAFSASWKITLVVLACFPLIVVASIIRNRTRVGST